MKYRKFFRPFMAFICSVLRPFGDLSASDKQNLLMNKRSNTKSYLPYFYENVYKYQSDYVTLDTLLNTNLSVLPFKYYFYSLYKFCEIFNRLDDLIDDYDQLKPTQLNQQLISILNQAGFLNVSSEEASFSSSGNQFKLDIKDEHQFLSDFIMDDLIKDANNLLVDETSIKIHHIYEQKFYIALLYLSNLLFDMTDPKKNRLPPSICVGNESFDLILPYILSLFQNPNTCVNCFLSLFNKISKFLSKAVLIKKFLPIIIQVLNVIDLNETIGIELNKDEEKLKYCKLFEYGFVNELRIIFGLEIFLTQICPYLIEAISGFKDFEYELESSKNLTFSPKPSPEPLVAKKIITQTQLSPVFDMDNSTKDIGSLNEQSNFQKSNSADVKTDTNVFFDLDNASLNSSGMNASGKQTNVSTTAFGTFVKIIQNLGPVLTCKYCCSDLFKMLAICYMNSKCLNTIEYSGL